MHEAQARCGMTMSSQTAAVRWADWTMVELRPAEVNKINQRIQALYNDFQLLITYNAAESCIDTKLFYPANISHAMRGREQKNTPMPTQ